MRHVLWALAVAAGLSLAVPASAAEPFDKGMVTISIDDGWSTQWTYARGLLNQRGIKSTFYIVTDAVSQNWSGFLTLPQLRTLVTDGHEIGSHTLTHPDLTTVSNAELLRQVSQSKSWLLANAGVASVPDFASPYGAYDGRVINVVKQYYASHRAVRNLPNWRDADPYELGAFDCHNGISVAQMKGWIDQAVAQRSWVILLFHEFTPGTPTRSTQVRNSDFTAILDYLHPVKTVTVAQGLALLHPAPPPPPVSGLPIYHETLESGFQDWSWATHDLFQTAVVRSGSRAISFEPDGWSGLAFQHPTPIDTAAFAGVELWVNGGTSGGQAVNIRLFLGGQEQGSAVVSTLLGAPVAAGAWQRVFMPFAALGISGTFDVLYIQDWSGQNQGTLYVDDMRLVPR
jgi:peptidoglycan/xylan/chitin deacetylase (PgdA/CDA1 family)